MGHINITWFLEFPNLHISINIGNGKIPIENISTISKHGQDFCPLRWLKPSRKPSDIVTAGELQELDDFVADLESRRNKDEKKIGLLSVMPLGPTLKMLGLFFVVLFFDVLNCIFREFLAKGLCIAFGLRCFHQPIKNIRQIHAFLCLNKALLVL